MFEIDYQELEFNEAVLGLLCLIAEVGACFLSAVGWKMPFYTHIEGYSGIANPRLGVGWRCVFRRSLWRGGCPEVGDWRRSPI